jgi:hypothetical protein
MRHDLDAMISRMTLLLLLLLLLVLVLVVLVVLREPEWLD